MAKFNASGVLLWHTFLGGGEYDSGNDIAVDTNGKQTFLSFGVGYARNLSASLRLRGEIGLASISYNEEALGGTQKGSGLGWKVGAGLDYFLSKKIFLFLTAAYSQASDEAETGKVELGGAQAGIGVGFAF
ncbi:MAG TPA: outer membrane beta-barrel protein [Acidobacteriota bacterium]